MKYVLIFLITVTLQAQDIKESGSSTPTPTPTPAVVSGDELNNRLSKLSNLPILAERCGVEDPTSGILEEKLICMERINHRVIEYLALRAKRDELRTRLSSIGGNMVDKYRAFNGISWEMNHCGFEGNHALIVWKWWKEGNTSNLECLESAHTQKLAKDEAEEQAEIARQNALTAVKNVDCSLETGKIKTICFALQALINP